MRWHGVGLCLSVSVSVAISNFIVRVYVFLLLSMYSYCCLYILNHEVYLKLNTTWPFLLLGRFNRNGSRCSACRHTKWNVFVWLEQIIMRLYTLAHARTAPTNSRAKGSVYKTRLFHAPCHVYFCCLWCLFTLLWKRYFYLEPVELLLWSY